MAGKKTHFDQNILLQVTSMKMLFVIKKLRDDNCEVPINSGGGGIKIRTIKNVKTACIYLIRFSKRKLDTF